MKKLRIVSILICMSLLLSITSPLAYATSSAGKVISANDSIVIDGNSAIYIFNDSTKAYCIYLDTASGNGSFALTYADNPDNMCELRFALPPSEINTSSSAFWQAQISSCLSNSQNWRTLYLPNTISTSIHPANESTRSSAAETYFTNWLQEKYGSPYTDRIIGYPMKQSQLFYVYQSLEYHIIEIMTHNLNYDITVAAFLLSAIGSTFPVVSVAVLASLFGGLATSVIPAGSRLDQYDISIYYHKYITVQGGNIVHASATKQLHYVGLARATTDFCCVDETSEECYYHPSEEYFENTTTLVNAAWEHLHNP